MTRFENKPPGSSRLKDENRSSGYYKSFIFYILVIVFLCTVVLSYIWFFVKEVEAEFSQKQLMDENIKLLKIKEQLQNEKAKLSNLTRIEEIARNKLNMCLPKRVEFLEIKGEILSSFEESTKLVHAFEFSTDGPDAAVDSEKKEEDYSESPGKREPKVSNVEMSPRRTETINIVPNSSINIYDPDDVNP